jgi:hypothetical protein
LTDQLARGKAEHEAPCKLAPEFADQIPDQVYSPAQIQSYLLMHIDDPQGAVNDFAAWKAYVTAEEEAAKQRKIREEEERHLGILMKEQREEEYCVQEQQTRMDWLVNKEEKNLAIKIAAKNARRAKKAVEASKAKGDMTPEESSTSVSADSSETDAE